MFLIVFVTLMISIIGLYAQVLSLQATKIYNSQVGLMQTMVAWHGAATNTARTAFSQNPASIPVGGCTVAATVGAPSACGFTIPAANLPPNYPTGIFSFYSIAYPNGTTPYVITFVHDTNSAGFSDPTKNLLLPAQGGTEIGYSLTALMKQFARAAPADLVYGSVTSLGTLTTGATNGNLSYTLIPAVIPAGSLAIISAAQ